MSFMDPGFKDQSLEVEELQQRITTLERELAEARKEAAGMRKALEAIKASHVFNGDRTYSLAHCALMPATTPTTKHFVSVDEVKALADEWEQIANAGLRSGVLAYTVCSKQLRKLVEESK